MIILGRNGSGWRREDSKNEALRERRRRRRHIYTQQKREERGERGPQWLGKVIRLV